jgi:hypothetical protein
VTPCCKQCKNVTTKPVARGQQATAGVLWTSPFCEHVSLEDKRNSINSKMSTKMNNKKKKNVKKGNNGNIATLSGQGGYYSEKVVPFMRKVIPDGTLAKYGGKAGGLLAPMISLNPYAGAVGRSSGSALGSAISRLVGFGDYSVVNNSLSTVGKAVDPGQPVPSFGVMGEGTKVRHRDFLMDILSPATPANFTNRSFPINPGLGGTFPWLSLLANNYQQYIVNGMVFEFVSSSSDFASNSALGTVILATDYDSIDAPFANKQQMENSQYAVSAKPSCSQIHTIECLPAATANKLYYTRIGAPPVNTDLRLYDLGNFQLATSGLTAPAGTAIGELWVSYDVTLYKPILGTGTGASQHITPGGTINVSNAWGTSPVTVGTQFFLPLSAGQLVCQIAGSYLIVTASACTVPTVPNYGGTGAIGMTIYAAATPLATTTTYLQEVGVTCSVGQLITVDISTWGSTTGWNTRVTPYDRSLA